MVVAYEGLECSMSVYRAELLFLDPHSGQVGIGLWFLNLVSPSLLISRLPELPRVWK